MEITITEQKENPLLERIEISGEIVFEGNTPRNSDVAESIAKRLNVDLSLIVVKHIYTHFGHQKANVKAVAYKTAEAKEKVEMTTKHMRKKVEGGEKKEKSEEAPKEDVKTKEKPEEKEEKVEEKKEKDTTPEENKEQAQDETKSENKDTVPEEGKSEQ